MTVTDYSYIHFVIKLCNFVTCNMLLPNTAHQAAHFEMDGRICIFNRNAWLGLNEAWGREHIISASFNYWSEDGQTIRMHLGWLSHAPFNKPHVNFRKKGQ